MPHLGVNWVLCCENGDSSHNSFADNHRSDAPLLRYAGHVLKLRVSEAYWQWISGRFQIRMLNKNIKDWRVNMTLKTILPVMIEVIVCAVCPFPGTETFTCDTVRSDGTIVVTPGVPIDVLLSIPMFLRLYLLFRIFVLHSYVYNDMKTRSIGSMNNLHFDFGFILKWAMTYTPSPLLLAFVTIYFLSSAYILRLVER